MQEFFTWTMLATYAGATLATTLITQLCKGIGFIDKLPTRVFAYIVALVVLLLGMAFTSGLTLSSGVLCVINAAVVSMASNGVFDAVTAGKNTK
ncbi:hypothetical protein LJC42_00365 [Eubacteriales bacterium OttesenSCG-928-K08]|nr:hypothetical protein [Eubacteriales bacterium OttesenSCG-928-K08]